jgi:tRNA(Arg) A34 adenosine deaminase TadA
VSDTFPHSAHDYFSRLSRVEAQAGAAGDYAIAAALVIRCQGTELVVVGRNTLFSSRDPAGHAERNAIEAARRIGAADPGQLRAVLERGETDGSVLVRDAPHTRTESILYATLEPCPMCAVCILNAGIDRVVIAASDPPSGTMLGGRLEALPELWPQLASRRSLRVVECQSHDREDRETFLPAELRDNLTLLFADSRAGLDEKLEAEGVLEPQAIAAACAASRAA